MNECKHPHHTDRSPGEVVRCAHLGGWMIEEIEGLGFLGHSEDLESGKGGFATWAEAEAWLLSLPVAVSA